MVTAVVLGIAGLLVGCAPGDVRCEGEGCLLTSDSEGGDAAPDEDVWPGPPPDLILGPYLAGVAGVDIVFDIPEGLASFTLTLAYASVPGARLGFHELVAPDGTVLFDAADGADINPTPTPYPGAASILVPISDDARALPAPGTYRARAGLFETADLVTFTPIEGEIGLAEVTLEPIEERGGVIDVHLAFTSETGLAEGDAAVLALLGELRRHLALAAVPLGAVTYATLPSDFDRVSDSDAIREACAAHSVSGPNGASINVFVISDLSFTAGYAGGVPGPPGLPGTDASCIVLEKQSSGAVTGVLAAHEIGHYVGLMHTTHLYYDAGQGAYVRGGYDPLSDTLECGAGTPLASCPDYHNLMFPFFPTTGLTLSPAQIEVVWRSPWLHEERRAWACPGGVVVDVSELGLASGATGDVDLLSASCGGAGGGERLHLYRLATAVSALRVEAAGLGFTPVIYVLGDDCAQELACAESAVELSQPQAGDYVIAVEGGGDFSLKVTPTP